SGKSRVVAETIVQAARRGWRVLLLAPTAPAIDVVLGRLAGCPEVLPVRLLGPDENAEALPGWLRSLTLQEQRRAFHHHAVQGASRARAQAEETCQRRQGEESLWPQLLPLADRHTELQQQLQNLQKRQAAVAGEVEREAAALPGADTGAQKGMPSGPFAADLI